MANKAKAKETVQTLACGENNAVFFTVCFIIFQLETVDLHKRIAAFFVEEFNLFSHSKKLKVVVWQCISEN